MAYFPESIVPERWKDPTEDVPGNPYVVNAVDQNKHWNEVSAIERVLGTCRPNFPVNYSGTGSASGFSGFSGSPYSNSQFCETNILGKLAEALNKLRDIRDNMLLTTSGVVCVIDPRVTGEDGYINFPSNWPVTWLETDMADDTNAYDSDADLPIMPYVQLTNIDYLPPSGYISIINETDWQWTYVDTSWRLVVEYPRFGTTTTDLLVRRRNLSTSVDIIRYSGVDTANNRILNVRRRQVGSTSTPHFAGDKIFKGRLSIQVAPSLYNYSTSYDADQGGLLYKAIHLKLSQDGKISGNLGIQSSGTLNNAAHTLYASYQAQLVRSIDPMFAYNVVERC